MSERSFEYDAFGPWIYPIEGEHTLPPLFSGYQESIEKSLMSFKIPFNAVSEEIIKKEDSTLTPVAYQPGMKYRVPWKFSLSFLNRLGLKKSALSGFVLLSNDSELVAIHHIYYTGRPSTERYSYTPHYLPYGSLTGIDRVPTDGPNPGLRLKTEHTHAVLPYEKASNLPQLLAASIAP